MRRSLVILILGLFVGGVEAQASEYCRQEKTEEPRDPGKGNPAYAKGVNAQGYARGMSDKEFEILKNKERAHRLLSKKCFRFMESELQDLYDQGRYEDIIAFDGFLEKVNKVRYFHSVYPIDLKRFLNCKEICLDPETPLSFLSKIVENKLWAFLPKDLPLKYCGTYLDFLGSDFLESKQSLYFKNIPQQLVRGMLEKVEKHPWITIGDIRFREYFFNSEKSSMTLSDLRETLFNLNHTWQNSVQYLEIYRALSEEERLEKTSGSFERSSDPQEPWWKKMKRRKAEAQKTHFFAQDLNQIFKHFPKLKNLRLENVFFDFEEPSEKHYGIQEISFCGSEISLLGLIQFHKALRSGKFPNLKKLSIRFSKKLGDESFGRFFDMQREFSKLELWCFEASNGMTKEGFERYKEGLKRNGIKKNPYFSNAS